MYGQNVKIIPTHQDVFGIKGKTEAQIIEGLKEFSSLTILHICTKLMLFLNSEGALKPAKQTELALGLLDQDTRQRLQAFINESDEDDPNIAIFHYAPVMMMVKLNLEHNDTSGLDINSVETRMKFSSLLISLCDIWIDNKHLGGNLSDRSQRKHFIEGFRAYQARQFLQENNSEPMINLLTRGRYLVDKARADGRINFDGAFKSATGIDLSLYLDILLMIMAEWTIGVNDIAKLDDISVRSTDEFFKHTNLSKEDINKFLDVVGFRIEDYHDLNQSLLERIGMTGDDTLVNFVTFMSKPILRYENKFLCVSPNFLLLQLTDGPYNIVREALKGTKQEKTLPIVWGDAYEDYVLKRLGSAFGKAIYPNVVDNGGDEAADALIDLGDLALVAEIKYPHWSFKARITGGRSDMHGFMERIAWYNPKKVILGQPKVVRKKGLGQIKYFIEKVNSGMVRPPFDLTTKILIPVLVLGEEYPCDPMNRALLEGYAASQGCITSKDNKIMPFILLTSEDVELIESLIEEVGLVKVKELLMQYVVRLHPQHRDKAFIKRPTSFKNEVFSAGIKVSNNKFMKAQSKACFKEVGKHFRQPTT